jgi:4-alpha-glucanotransferase
MAAGRLQRGDYDPADYRFHLFAAWCAEEQMAAATSEDAAARLYLDLPLGVHPDGYDTWRLRHLFADGVTAGAPPDTFFERGQNWGFPPLRPDAMRADGYRYVVECLRLQLRFAGALRLDHVMALERIFWVPAGFDASDGVYVRYPREELAALLTLESHRHGTMIVGEDLGTVTPSIRRTMEEHAIQRMFVVQFEVDPDRSPPLSTPGPDAVASLNTHDLPTFAAWLPGTDLEERVWLGHLDRDAAEVMRGQRQRTVRSLCRSLGLAEDPPAPQATLEAVLERLAGGPARLVMVNAEDAWLETRQQNVPGTTTERSNWQSRTPFAAFSLATDPQLADLLELVNRGRADRVASPTGDP